MTCNIATLRVKSSARYICQKCGSTEFIQGHHRVPKDDSTIIPLCADCHSKKHPDVPRGLFFAKSHQPYWENKSASSLAKLLGVHPRTIIRASGRLSISKGILSADDEETLCLAVTYRYYQGSPQEYKHHLGTLRKNTRLRDDAIASRNIRIAHNIEKTKQDIYKLQKHHLYTSDEWERRYDNLITPYQVMTQLGISRRAVYDLARKDKLLVVTWIEGYAHFDQQNINKFQAEECS